MEISVSNHEKQIGRIERLLKSGKLVYIKKATAPPIPAKTVHRSQPSPRGGATFVANKTKNKRKSK